MFNVIIFGLLEFLSFDFACIVEKGLLGLRNNFFSNLFSR